MIKQFLSFGVLISALLAGCSEDAVGPGSIARPLIGNYDLESRTVNTTTQSDTGTAVVRDTLLPPRVRGLLRLNANGRYGQIDTILVSDSTSIRIQNGRWSVLNDMFFFVTDDNQQFEDRFTYDGLRLVRTSEALRHSTGRLFSITDVWLRQQDEEASPDE